MKLYFMEPSDICSTYGRLEFRARGPRDLGPVAGIPDPTPQFALPAPHEHGGWWLYGWQQVAEEGTQRWWIVRARTCDGIHFESFERLYEESGEHWLGMSDFARNEKTGEILLLKWARGKPGHALWVYGSEDGVRWRLLKDEPVYHDHDSFGVIWDPETKRYIVHQATYQPREKKFPDNIGDGKRRVTHIRTSVDGVNWDPPEDVGFGGPYMPEERLIVPDEQDPPELEFYRMRAFPYGDRYVAMVLNYAPSPQVVNPHGHRSKHGPQLSCEWWTSNDALEWRRPYRDHGAAGDARGAMSHAPFEVNGQLRWVLDRNVYALDADRLVGVHCRGNGQFSTRVLRMPGTPLSLNAAAAHSKAPSTNMHKQAYLMAELQDAEGSAIEGYECERCAFLDVDQPDLPLRWGGKDGTELAGKQVRLRLFFRDATVYAASSA